MSLKRSIYLGLLFIFFALCLFGILIKYWTTNSLSSTFPSDQSLISLFANRHHAFEKLRLMANEDHGVQADFFSSDSSSKLARSRQHEYDNLLSSVCPGVIEARDYNGTIRFCLSGQGTAIGPGWDKGIEYIPEDYEKEGIIVKRLDEVSNLAPNVYLVSLEPNWFIFYQKDD